MVHNLWDTFQGHSPDLWFATTPLWEWLLSHWDVTGLLKAIFMCHPLDWTEMSCESHLNMHFICQTKGSSWSLVGMSSQHSCRASPMEMPLESQPGTLFLLRRRQHKEHSSAELETAQNSLTDFTWKADKDITTDSLSSTSSLPPAVGFHSPHGYFVWILQLPVRALAFVSALPVIPCLRWMNQKVILYPRDHPCQTSSFHQQDQVLPVLGWTLQSLWRALKPEDSLEEQSKNPRLSKCIRIWVPGLDVESRVFQWHVRRDKQVDWSCFHQVSLSSFRGYSTFPHHTSRWWLFLI